MWINPTHFNLAYSKDHFTNRFNIASYDRQHVLVLDDKFRHMWTGPLKLQFRHLLCLSINFVL